MNTFSKITDPLKSFWDRCTDRLKSTLLGAHHERLDFLIDSFHKLGPTEQKVVLSGGIFTVFLVVTLIVAGYFSQVGALKYELETSISSLRQIRTLSSQLQSETQRFNGVVRDIQDKTGELTNFKSFFEKVSRDEEINIGTLTEKVVPLPESNLLSEHLQEVQADITLDNISLPKLLKYMTALEKSGKHLQVSHLSIRSRYETKLYFDSKISVRGYQTK